MIGKKYRHALDDKLFLPLAKFFRDNPAGERTKLEEFISTRGIPEGLKSISQKIGFVFEEYVKLSLMDFAERTRIQLLGDRIEERFVEGGWGGYIISSNKWGNVYVFDALSKKRGIDNRVLELDGLYKFYDDNGIIPIIFEMSLKRQSTPGIRGLRYKSDLEKEIVENLYNNQAWICRICPARELRNARLYLPKESEYKEERKRKVTIPNPYDVLFTIAAKIALSPIAAKI